MNNKLLTYSTKFCKRNASTILTYVGGVGVVATAVTAVRATPKALERIEVATEEKGEELTKMEVVKVAWKPYIPAIAIGTATITCVFGANVLNKRTQAALTSAYALLDNSYKEYKKKTVELYGEDADKAIRDGIAADKYEEQDIQEEDDGKQLFYDVFSNRYFRATNEAILRAEYELNKEVQNNFYATINEYYDMVGLERIDGGDALGWSSAQLYDMYWNDWIDFWHEKVKLEDGMEYFAIHYSEPFPDFEDY